MTRTDGSVQEWLPDKVLTWVVDCEGWSCCSYVAIGWVSWSRQRGRCGAYALVAVVLLLRYAVVHQISLRPQVMRHPYIKSPIYFHLQPFNKEEDSFTPNSIYADSTLQANFSRHPYQIVQLTGRCEETMLKRRNLTTHKQLRGWSAGWEGAERGNSIISSHFQRHQVTRFAALVLLPATSAGHARPHKRKAKFIFTIQWI